MLPIIQTKDTLLQLMQTRWATLINPVIDNPLSKGRIISGISLVNGDNVIAHGLGRPLQGWIVIRQYTAFYGLYDKQSTNVTPQLTLVLNAAGATNIDLYVF